MDLRYQFFISSTFEDLREERQQVIQAVLEMDHIPVGMELFPSADEAPWDVVRRTIAASDYYVVLSAGRYGSTTSDGLGFTEKEFDLAEELGVPIIGFIHESPQDLPAAKREGTSRGLQKLAAFHDKIRQRHVRRWRTVEELGLQASKAIIYITKSQPRVGWIRADQARSNADLEKLEELRRQIDLLEKENGSLAQEVTRLDDFIRRSVLAEEDIQPSLLAKGADSFEIDVRYTPETGADQVKEGVHLTWDECFMHIGPDLFGKVAWRDFNGRYAFEGNLKSLLKNKVGLSGTRTVSYDKLQVDKIIFQFKQLGYLYLGHTKGGQQGWTLTDLGEAHLTRLLTTKS